MRLPFAYAFLSLAACGQATSLPPEPARCGPNVPETAQHPITVRPSALAGQYELIQVQTQPSGGITSGRLYLSPLDSAAKAGAMGGPVRDLIGWLDLVDGDSAWRAAVASRDPGQPGVVLAAQHLRIGPRGVSEGWARNLEITAVGADGFWGWWRAERGLAIAGSGSRRALPDPAGYFCALRLDR
jgi:hypothetical protein